MNRTQQNIQMIRLSSISPDPDQPRRTLRGVKRVQRSLEAEGQLNPILVTPTSDFFFQIVDGEQRYRAAKALGWEEISCIVTTIASDEKIRDVQFHSNFFRDDLDPFERADELAALAQRRRWTPTQLATLTGLSRSIIESNLGLARVPEEVRQRLAPVLMSVAVEKLYNVAREKTLAEMNDVVDKILAGDSIAEIRETRRINKEGKKVSKTKGMKTQAKAAAKDRLTDRDCHVDEEPETVVDGKPDSLGQLDVSSDQEDGEAAAGADAAPTNPTDMSGELGSCDPTSNVNRSDVAPFSEDTDHGSEEPCDVEATAAISKDERFVQAWWQAYSCHAVRVSELRGILREAGIARFDVSHWLEQAHGTIIGNHMVVSVTVIQEKRVHQLVPVELGRPAYLADLSARLAENNKKVKAHAA